MAQLTNILSLLLNTNASSTSVMPTYNTLKIARLCSDPSPYIIPLINDYVSSSISTAIYDYMFGSRIKSLEINLSSNKEIFAQTQSFKGRYDYYPVLDGSVQYTAAAYQFDKCRSFCNALMLNTDGQSQNVFNSVLECITFLQKDYYKSYQFWAKINDYFQSMFDNPPLSPTPDNQEYYTEKIQFIFKDPYFIDNQSTIMQYFQSWNIQCPPN